MAADTPSDGSLVGFDDLLDGEERSIRDTVRRLVRERLLPHVPEWFETGCLPREVAKEVGELGLLGMHLQGYGCAGMSAVAYGLACLELEAGDSGLRSLASVQGSLAMRGPLTCLNEARYSITWGALGAGRACYEAARDYARTRQQFGRPVGGFQLTQQKLVDMRVELDKGLLLALHLGRAKDSGALWAAQVSLGKLNNVREALKIAREARTVLGANGITLEYPVFRHMVNLESVLTYEGMSEVHTLALGQELTGLPAFR